MTCRIIDVFVRHVCLVRPLGEEGKLKITADIAQVGRNHTCMHTYLVYVHTHTRTHTHAFRSCISLVYHSTYVCVHTVCMLLLPDNGACVASCVCADASSFLPHAV